MPPRNVEDTSQRSECLQLRWNDMLQMRVKGEGNEKENMMEEECYGNGTSIAI